MIKYVQDTNFEMAVLGTNTIIIFISVVGALVYSGQVSVVVQKLNEVLHWKLGCNPIYSIGNVSLHYFSWRGRAEAIRLLLEDHKIPYSETRFVEDTWQAAQELGIKSGLYAFGQVPVIEMSRGKHVSQSKGIYTISCGALKSCIDDFTLTDFNEIINVAHTGHARSREITRILEKKVTRDKVPLGCSKPSKNNFYEMNTPFKLLQFSTDLLVLLKSTLAEIDNMIPLSYPKDKKFEALVGNMKTKHENTIEVLTDLLKKHSKRCNKFTLNPGLKYDNYFTKVYFDGKSVSKCFRGNIDSAKGTLNMQMYVFFDRLQSVYYFTKFLFNRKKESKYE